MTEIIKVCAEGRAIYPSLNGRRVIISGGGSGIGSSLVEHFACQGSAVAFLDIQEAASLALIDALPAVAVTPIFRTCDIIDCDAYVRTLHEVMDALGGCDVLVNNAANDDRHRFEEVTPAYWDDRIAVNLRHQFFAAQAVAPVMRRCGGGSIVNLGSISWHLGLKDLTLYQVAKAGVEGLTRSLARELGRDNIRVNAIIPGNVQTPRQMRWYTPEAEAEIIAAQCLDGRIQPADIAAMALFLASDDARYCTAHNFWVDAGWR